MQIYKKGMWAIQQEIFYSGKLQPKCEVFSSLAVNAFTTSILVDYAVHESKTPTDWPKTVADKFSKKEKQTLESLRSILAHGWVLRDYVLKHLPREHPAHKNWEGLIHWFETLTDQDLYQLATEGILSGLDFYRTYMEPMDSVEECLQKLGTSVPDEATFSDPGNQMIGLRALLLSWRMESAESIANMITNPAEFRERLVFYVKALWKNGLKEEWTSHQKLLGESVRMTREMTRTKMSVKDLIIRITGLEPEEKAFQLLDQASALTFSPCLQLGELLSIFVIEDVCYVLFDPILQGKISEPVQVHNEEKKQGEMTSLLEVIGDKTRLKILMLLKEKPGMDTGHISKALDVHASTISRHCQQLEKNGIIVMKKENAHKRYSLNQNQMKEIAEWLMNSFGSPE